MTHHATPANSVQFEQDVHWCLNKIHTRYANEPYWEETFTCHFSREPDEQTPYWKAVNAEALKRYTDHNNASSLVYKDAYRELSRMTLLLINIISGNLMDASKEYRENEELAHMLTLSHKLWQQRAPSTLQQHDEMLQQCQVCLNLFEQMTKSPLTSFTHYAESMNKLRVERHTEVA